MPDAENELNAEIARLEAELEKTRLESKLKHLQAELHAVEDSGVLDDDEYMVIKELVDDTGDDSYEEYEEEEYEEEYEEEEYVEEYEEEEEVTEEYEEEEIVEEEPAQEQAPARLPYGNLRKAPLSAYQQKEAQNAAASANHQTPVTKPPPPVPTTYTEPVQQQEPSGPRVKSKVRPPPGKGGKPKPRKDPEAKPKPEKKYPLSRLLARNSKSKPADPDKAAATATPTTQAPKKVVPKKTVRKVLVKKPAAPKTSAAPAKASAAGGPFTRRLIPNIQPSKAGEETIFEQLLGPKLITNPKLHKCSTKGCVKDQELICLYFAAKWKSDCKRFNPLIKDFYYNVAQPNNLEVIYISADRSLLEFKDVYATMPFLAMPAGTTDIKNELTKRLKIIEMPALVVLDDEGSVVSVEGVKKIQELEKGNVAQANQLVDRWKKTRPIPIDQVQQDMTLLHGTMERGTVYWQN